MAATKKKVDYGAKAKSTQRKTAEQNNVADGVALNSMESTVETTEPGITVSADQSRKPQTKLTRSVSAANQNTTQISFRISADLKRRLKIYAAKHDKTVNEAFREIMDEWLSTHE